MDERRREAKKLMVFHTNLNRVFIDLDRALKISQSYTMQTDVVHKVEAVRNGYMVRKTDEKVPELPPSSVTLEMDQKRREGIISEDEFRDFYDSTYGAQAEAWAKAKRFP